MEKAKSSSDWGKWREIAGLLTNLHVPSKNRGSIYSSRIRPVFLYGMKVWTVRIKLEESLQSCDRHMLRYMTGVPLADRVSSVKIPSRCGVKTLTLVMRENRLRWCGHVKRRLCDEVLGEVPEMGVPGTKHKGRSKKTWMKNIEEDMYKWKLTGEDVRDCGR